MDTLDIQIIRRIYETGSLTKAAADLYISPQALSKRIQKIEKDLDTVLFDRTSTGMIPTAECKRFYDESKVFYDSLSEFINSFRNKSEKKRVRITIASSLGVVALITPEKIHQFRDAHPDIDIKFREYPDKEVDLLVKEGKVNIGLAIAPINSEEFVSATLTQLPFCVLTQKNSYLANKSRISFEDLQGVPIALENQNFKVYDIITSACASQGIRPNIYFETMELSLAHSLARQNECVAISVLCDTFLRGSEDLDIKQFRNPIYWQILAIKKVGDPFMGAEKQLVDYLSDILS